MSDPVVASARIEQLVLLERVLAALEESCAALPELGVAEWRGVAAARAREREAELRIAAVSALATLGDALAAGRAALAAAHG